MIFFRRLKTHSLFANIFIVLTLGMLADQLLSYKLVSNVLEKQTREKMFSFMEADIAFVVEVLNDIPPANRFEKMGKINRGFYPMAIFTNEISNPIIPRQRFEALYKVSDNISMRLGIEKLHWYWIGIAEDSRPAMYIPLNGKQFLEVDATDPIPELPLVMFAIYLSGIFAIVSFFAWLALNMALSPLGRLVDSAASLGRDIKTPIRASNESHEIEIVSDVLEKMRLRIVDEFDRHTEMLAAISHDLQTPITRVLLRVESIDEADVKRGISSDLTYMSSLISKILEYGRTSKLSFEPVLIDFDALLEMLVNQAKDQGFDITLEGRLNDPIWGSMNELRRAIQNVLDNAFKYGDKAHVKVFRDQKNLVLSIQDEGSGIADSEMKQIVNPFFRADKSRNSLSGGSGLGLSITRNIISAHNGNLIFQNRPKGLEVRIEIPLEKFSVPNSEETLWFYR